MSAFCQRLFCQNSLNQDSPKFFFAKVSSFTITEVNNLKNHGTHPNHSVILFIFLKPVAWITYSTKF